ncbi:hypothetical protein [Streptomyces sp. NPDC020362]|uniref:hypothetical protein n=1 Tax=unclassified Streptomyces TaxID=2593676 RepID=UPI0033E4E2CA
MVGDNPVADIAGARAAGIPDVLAGPVEGSLRHMVVLSGVPADGMHPCRSDRLQVPLAGPIAETRHRTKSLHDAGWAAVNLPLHQVAQGTPHGRMRQTDGVGD